MQEIAVPTTPALELNDTEIIVFCQPCLKKKELVLLADARRRYPYERDDAVIGALAGVEAEARIRAAQWLWITDGASSGRLCCRFCQTWIEITPEMIEPFREEDARCLGRPRFRAASPRELHS